MHVRLINDSELTLGVSVRVDGCLSVCGPAMVHQLGYVDSRSA